MGTELNNENESGEFKPIPLAYFAMNRSMVFSSSDTYLLNVQVTVH
jgi:hypothetical protein